MILWQFIAVYLMGGVLFYAITHVPFDVVMLIRKKDVVYPNPPFSTPLQGVLFVGPSLLLWGYLLIIPLLSIRRNRNYLSFAPFPFGGEIWQWIQYLGMILITV